MTRPEASEDDKTIETWETAIAGAVWVWVYDRREDRYISQSVGGKTGSRRLHITRDDRKYNQEQMPYENAHQDPFTNGALRLISAATRDELLDVRYHYTDADLAELFEVRDPHTFMEGVTDIHSELIVRRLLAMAETIGTQAQNQVLKEYVSQKWPIGGTQKTVREMIEAGERMGAERIW